ncbi:MAG: N-acylneuraminate cytidylyltransferase [Parcubacteria group bacterium Gr01-1014_44]|nr:MAG: N-acylneuraminate cytidylyltransferase [Parcubacteria group bacterium Gr01-1014_44]
MINNKQILALIQARGGSKGLPKKNIRLLGGKPLISHSIEVALQSKLIDRVVVSTDSEEIAAVAKAAGAEVPFLRPAELAQDLTPNAPVVEHCLTWLKEHENYSPDLIVFLYPTGPFRTVEEIEEAINILENHPEADSLRSMVEPHHSPYKMWKPQGDYVRPFVENFDGPKDFHTSARQLLPKVYKSTPDIHVFKVAMFWDKKSTIGEVVLPYYLKRPTIDIDHQLDLEIAEFLLKNGSIK